MIWNAPWFRSVALASFTGVLLTACGFEGADRESEQTAAPQVRAEPGVGDPDFAEFPVSDIPDPEERPIMRLQVVLDRQGFAPGAIDGGMGLSTRNALRGFQEANRLSETGELDAETREALERWADVPATRVVRIPQSWGQIEFRELPSDVADQAELDHLGYESLDEKLAERFHTTVAVLRELNPDGRPAGLARDEVTGAAEGAEGVPAFPPRTRVTPTPRPGGGGSAEGGDGEAGAEVFRPGQLVRVPNVGAMRIVPRGNGDADWERTLASLGVSADQPRASRVVVSRSGSWLKAYGADDRLIAVFTVTTGSERDPLPLGEWGITGIARNPPFSYNPELLWDVADDEAPQRLPPGPNSPVGVVWIALTKEHYGIHGTSAPETIGRAQSHGCVRLTNWDAARLAGMVDTSTRVTFEA